MKTLRQLVAIALAMLISVQPIRVLAGIMEDSRQAAFTARIAYGQPTGASPFPLAMEIPPKDLKPDSEEAKEQAETLKLLQKQIQDEKIKASTEMMSEIMKLIMDEYLDYVSPEMLYESALRGMMNALDGYSVYFDDSEMASFTGDLSGAKKGIGISMTDGADELIEIVKVYKNSPAEKAGLMAGDILIKIENTDVKGMQITEFQRRVAESDTDIIHLEIIRDDDVKSFDIEKDFFEVDSVAVYKLDDVLDSAKGKDNSDIRLVVIAAETETTAREMRETIDMLKAEEISRIILDLRGNGGGYEQTALDICNMLVPEGVIISTIDKQGNKAVKSSSLKTVPFDKIYVLVDEYTASAAEIICSALQDSKAATLYGRVTYGKGVMQGLYSMPTGGGIKLTTQEYLRRNGGKINKIGVTPDIIIDSGDILEEAYKMIQK